MTVPSYALNLQCLSPADLVVVCEPGTLHSRNAPILLKLSNLGYAKLWARRSEDTHRGGVLLFSRDTPGRTFTPLIVPRPPDRTDIQAAALLVRQKGAPTVIAVGVYATCTEASARAAEDLITFLNSILASFNHSHPTLPVLLMGDFNARHVAFGDVECNVRGRLLVQFALRAGYRVIGAPTRGDSCLDLILVPHDIVASDPTVARMMSTDHAAISSTIDPHPRRSINIPRWRFSVPARVTSTTEGRAAFLAVLEEHLAGRGGTPHGQDQRIVRALWAAAADGGAKWVRVCEPSSPPVPTVDELLAAAHKSPWAALALLRPRQRPEQAASALLTHFGARGKQHTHGDPPLAVVPPVEVKAVTAEEVRAAVEAHNPHGAQDPDGLSPAILKLAAQSPIFIERLASLVTLCMKKGVVPARWRQATLTCIPKPGKSPQLIDSYRAIANTSLLARTADRIVDNRIKFDWKPHPHQLGFRKGVPIDTVVWAIVGQAQAALKAQPAADSTRHRTLVIAADISDAFPSTSVQSIIAGYAGVSADCLAFKKAMLSHRQCRVRCDADDTTDWEEIIDGTNQGSVGGPTDFSAASGGLLTELDTWSKTVRSNVCHVMIADDLTFYATGRPHDINVVARGFLRILERWAAAQQMRISIKTSALYISDKHVRDADAKWPFAPLRCGSVVFTPLHKGSIKILGYHLDARLTMSTALEKAIDQHNGALVMMLPFVYSWNITTRRVIYEAIALSHLRRLAPLLLAVDASDAVWSRLDATMGTAARLITGTCATARTHPCLYEAGLVPARQMAGQAQLRLLFKLMAIGEHIKSTPVQHAIAFLERATSQRRRVVSGVIVDHVGIAPWETTQTDRVLIHARPELDEEELQALQEAQRMKSETTKGSVPTMNPLELALKSISNARVEGRLTDAFVTFTDGSVKQKSGRYPSAGAGGAAIMTSPCQQEFSKQVTVGAAACSFSAEIGGLECALFLAEHVELPASSRLVILTDSQSALSALAKGPLRQPDSRLSTLWQRLLHLVARKDIFIELRFIFGHTAWDSADKADELAREAAKKGAECDAPPWWRDAVGDFEAALADSVARSSLHGSLRGECKVFARSIWPAKVLREWQPADVRLLCQLRTNSCEKVGGHLIGRVDLCCRCRAATKRSSPGYDSMVQHIFKCWKMRGARKVLRIRGVRSLWTNPVRALAYAKQFLTVG
jgi:ribonuclease HI